MRAVLKVLRKGMVVLFSSSLSPGLQSNSSLPKRPLGFLWVPTRVLGAPHAFS